MPLKAWLRLMRISEYLGGPQTVMYGLAAVSSEPRPLPMTKMQTQKPAKLAFLMAAMARRAPRPELCGQHWSGAMLGILYYVVVVQLAYHRGTDPR